MASSAKIRGDVGDPIDESEAPGLGREQLPKRFLLDPNGEDDPVIDDPPECLAFAADVDVIEHLTGGDERLVLRAIGLKQGWYRS